MRLVSSILLLLFLAAGCNHPTEVVVQPLGSEQEDPLDVTPLQMVDTTTYQGGIDSLALTPVDQARFAGLMLVTNTVFDKGSSVVSKASSRVLFADLNRPYSHLGEILGGFGLRLKVPLTINGLVMVPIPHIIRAASVAIPWGVEYYRDLTGTFRQDTDYTWSAGEDSLGAIGIPIHAPPSIAVNSPQGGGVYTRDQDLKLRWTGNGDMTIYLSVWRPLTGKTLPIMKLHPLGTRGHAVLASKILRALPRERFYVFTFVLADRNESVHIARFNGEILAQGSSVYNTYVELQ